MGLEARCQCIWAGTKGIVQAHLDSTGLDLKGAHRLHVDLSEIVQAEVRDGALWLKTGKGELLLELPERAETWAKNIRNPRSRVQKLGIKPGCRVLLAGLADLQLQDELTSQDCTMLRRAGKSSVDAIFLLAENPDQLDDLARYRDKLVDDGALWVIRKKGKDAPVTEARVREAAKQSGLVDVKVVAFSATHSSEKLVIPRANRSKHQT